MPNGKARLGRPWGRVKGGCCAGSWATLQVRNHPIGLPWHLRARWYWLLGATGSRQVRFHDLRHTYASLLCGEGTPPKYVQEQLGHSSIQVTMDIYSHLFPNGNREWVKRLDDPLGEGKSAPQPHLGSTAEEQGSHKTLELLVAVGGFEPSARGL